MIEQMGGLEVRTFFTETIRNLETEGLISREEAIASRSYLSFLGPYTAVYGAECWCKIVDGAVEVVTDVTVEVDEEIRAEWQLWLEGGR